ncbi:hypothetical protein [Rhodococcus koreensis]
MARNEIRIGVVFGGPGEGFVEDFGAVPLGTTEARSFTARGPGTDSGIAMISVTTTALSGSGGFTVAGNECRGLTLNYFEDACLITVEFTPEVVGQHRAGLRVQVMPDTPMPVVGHTLIGMLIGTGIAPEYGSSGPATDPSSSPTPDTAPTPTG